MITATPNFKEDSITLEEVNAPYSLDSMLIKANETYVRIHKYEFFKKGE